MVVIGGIYLHNRNSDATNNLLKDNAYIDMWEDNSMHADIALYSTGSGSGANEKSYLGAQLVHYIINKNGEIYTYQNKMTGKRENPQLLNI